MRGNTGSLLCVRDEIHLLMVSGRDRAYSRRSFQSGQASVHSKPSRITSKPRALSHDMSNRTKAAALNQRGLKEQDRGRLDEAVNLFEQAADADPRWSVPAYNLGLIYKRQKNWKKSL